MYRVRPHHVAAVNRLAREHFWPGVDVSESLAHPVHFYSKNLY